MSILTAKIKAMVEYTGLKNRVAELARYKSIGVMTASICHQILNPLSGIRGPAYVIEKHLEKAGIKNDKIDQNITYIKENSIRINEIIDTLRSIFKGKMFEYEDIPVKNYIGSIVAIFSEKASDYITFEIITDDIMIRSNKGALTQILINLLSNAIEAIQDNGKIWIECDEVHITIKDNGCGISEKEIEKIFDLNYTTKAEGTGFGLYLVKQLTERLNMSIAVRSVVGEGTEVILGL
jgi:polar amino acid transport system substrate-binding protein